MDNNGSDEPELQYVEFGDIPIAMILPHADEFEKRIIFLQIERLKNQNAEARLRLAAQKEAQHKEKIADLERQLADKKAGEPDPPVTPPEPALTDQ